MRQLPLSLTPPPEPALENFVPGRNAELLALLSQLARGEEAERFVYIWGSAGSGKTHLLRSMYSALTKAGVVTNLVRGKDSLVDVDPAGALLVDDVDAFDETAQASLFNAFNLQRDGGGIMIASASTPASGLGLRRDLVTRLGWGLVYQVHSLSDDEKKMAMAERARALGLTLSEGVIDYLLSRQARDLRGLLAMLDALDRYSMESKRAVTIPLVRELFSASG